MNPIATRERYRGLPLSASHSRLKASADLGRPVLGCRDRGSLTQCVLIPPHVVIASDYSFLRSRFGLLAR